MPNRLQLGEIVKAFEQRDFELFTLKVFPIVADFDADREAVRFFAFNEARLIAVRHLPQFSKAGTFGTTLAVLHRLASEKFISNNGVANALGISSARVREAILVLEGSGFVARFNEYDSGVRVSLRGRVFLELLGRIRIGFDLRDWGGELGCLLDRLGCDPEDSIAVKGERQRDRPTALDALVLHIQAAEQQWGIDVTEAVDYRSLVPQGVFVGLTRDLGERSPRGESNP